MGGIVLGPELVCLRPSLHQWPKGVFTFMMSCLPHEARSATCPSSVSGGVESKDKASHHQHVQKELKRNRCLA